MKLIASHTIRPGSAVTIQQDSYGRFVVTRTDPRGFFEESNIRRESQARELAEALGMPKAAK